MKIKDYSITGEEFELKYNTKYDMYYTHPLPDCLSRYYESENYISHTDSNEGLIAKLYQWIKKYNLKKKVKLINKYSFKKEILLDVGAGTGEFLLTAKQSNWNILGIEPNKKARKKASEKGLNLYTDILEVSENKFDCITLWHVLEHIPDLENQILFLNNKLKEQGTLVIAVPNYKSWDAQHYKNYWAAYDVPRHLWHFSKTSIEKLFSKVNMEIVKTKPMWFDAFYVSLLSEKYKTGKSNFLVAFINGCRSNFFGLRKGEYSSQIYILKRKNE